MLRTYLEEFPAAVLSEGNQVLFDMAESSYSLGDDADRFTLQIWGESGNLVRRVAALTRRANTLTLETSRFGKVAEERLQFNGEKSRRTPTARDSHRARYARQLERALRREFPDWSLTPLRTARDLEHSFGPAYARGVLTRGSEAWAVVGVGDEEDPSTIDGILTIGILWMHECRQRKTIPQVVRGLRVVCPPGRGDLTASRIAFLHEQVQWELMEFDRNAENFHRRDPADHGNMRTALSRLLPSELLRNRFRESIARVLAILPPDSLSIVEQRVRPGSTISFLLHGLEFARIQPDPNASGFNGADLITFGTGARETLLTPGTAEKLRAVTRELFRRRTSTGDKRDALYRNQPERWLESRLRLDVSAIESRLRSDMVFTQVAAFAAGDRGMIDLLSMTKDGRLAVIEIKAQEDLHLALQGLDYWIRIRWHHLQNPDPLSGLGTFQQNGYFPGVFLSAENPRLYLVAPALRVHPAVPTVLLYFSARVDWTVIALDERWREEVKVVWRKASSRFGR